MRRATVMHADMVQAGALQANCAWAVACMMCSVDIVQTVQAVRQSLAVRAVQTSFSRYMRLQTGSHSGASSDLIAAN